MEERSQNYDIKDTVEYILNGLQERIIQLKTIQVTAFT